MKRCGNIGLIVTICLASASSLHAQELAALQRCATIDDDTDRLDCYDRAMNLQAEPDVAQIAPELPVTPGDDVSPERPPAPSSTMVEPTPAGTEVAPVAAEPVSGQAAAVKHAVGETVSGEPPGESFGLPPSPVKPDESAATTQLTAPVVEVLRRPRGEHVVVLENGQVWKEEFSSRYFPVEPGDTVIIKKRRFGGYRLVTPSGKGYAVERIR